MMRYCTIFLANFLFIITALTACSSGGNADKKNEVQQTPSASDTPGNDIASDTKPETISTNNPTKPVQQEVIATGTQCAIEKSRQVIVKTQAEFDKLWKEAFAGIDMAPEKPQVNFSEKWVVGLFLGMMSSGGHSVELKEIKVDNGMATLMVKHIKPGAGCISSMAIEYPYLIASITQLGDTKTEFKTMTEEKKCE